MVPAHFHDIADDKMNSNLVKILQDCTWVTLKNQFNSGNSYIGRRTYDLYRSTS